MHLVAFVLALGIALALMPGVKQLSWRLGMLDYPAARKVHRQPTPLLGGLAIYAGLSGAVALVGWREPDLRLFLACSAYLLVLGLLDDRLDIPARYRLALQAVAAVAVAAAGFRFSLGAGAPVAYFVTVVWLLGVINATNCMDCVDGAAGTYAAVASGWFCILALADGRLVIAALAAALAGGTLGFLRHNLPPASVFMGDLGSTFVGLMLGILSIASAPRGGGAFRFPVEVLVLAPIVYDFLLVHVRRYRGGVRDLRLLLSSTGKDHLPHRLIAMHLTAREADGVLATLAGLWGIFAFALSCGAYAAAILAGMVALGSVLFCEGVIWRLTRCRRVTFAPVVGSAAGGGD